MLAVTRRSGKCLSERQTRRDEGRGGQCQGAYNDEAQHVLNLERMDVPNLDRNWSHRTREALSGNEIELNLFEYWRFVMT